MALAGARGLIKVVAVVPSQKKPARGVIEVNEKKLQKAMGERKV